jgi:hypothetical protein
VAYRCETGGEVTFFAGSYHADPGVFGSLIVDGTAHAFTDSLASASLPADVDGQTSECAGAPTPVKWQTVALSGLLNGSHTVTTTATSAIEDPWPGCFPKDLDIQCSVPLDVEVTADSMLRAGDRNTNEGANPVLSISGAGNTRVVLESSASATTATSATLYLDIVTNHGNWGPAGKWISVHPLAEGFAEGNGAAWNLPPPGQKSSIPGVTWNCPTDTNLGNQASDCVEIWSGGEFGAVIDSVLITNDTVGTIQFDLTTWVNANVGQPLRFLIKKDNDGAPGRIDMSSREGSGTAPKITVAP